MAMNIMAGEAQTPRPEAQRIRGRQLETAVWAGSTQAAMGRAAAWATPKFNL